MYCSACGSAIPANLSYCNKCGARIGTANNDSIAKPSQTYPESLIWAIVAVFVCGLGAIIGMMAVMKNVVGFETHLILAITMISLLLTVAVEGLFITLLFKSKLPATDSIQTPRLKEHQTKELAQGERLGLPEPLSSVTEETTRAFEPIYRRDAKL
jgi:anaerobic C4-dicarboxylate transporter